MDRKGGAHALRSSLTQRFALVLADIACRLPRAVPSRSLLVMGLSFPSPLGIAAGFDRNGRLARRVAALGFGFNEIGSLAAAGLTQLQPFPRGEARLGINLTLDARRSAAETCALLRNAWPHADYLVLNLISPASAPLLSQTVRLRNLLAALREENHQLNLAGNRRVPLAAKLRCLPEQIPFSLAGLLLDLRFDGLLAAHDPGPPATRERYRAWQDPRQQAQACEQIEHLRRFCGENMALMSVGGIQTATHLRARMSAGAELVQVHTALLRQGPWLAHRLLR
ncbi:phosphoserine aminotransferase [Pseudomonas stutzeri]|uniref:Phosphoserine aminotransferase n=1 Tax=Stutzerimonas stutzeri TaxID=316 RepID=A0A2N8S024_STUST|nr:phosphoserine aminotransferase [Stutzerimonas stutzeri]MCQ4295315.1 phosphoserine aminotransferase [Stutzerimonas stutzeri]PNF79975.1 phosphoserine aminotransferase [Stutzerimonas stutzeri]